jgi:DNA-binding LacI/PurR family transcriptional regulator
MSPQGRCTNSDRTPARAAAEKILKLKDRPTAIFAASDVMALEVLDEAYRKHLKVPEDLSIIGFDNNPLSEMGTVKLSTVSQPLLEMGRLGAEQLGQITKGKLRLPSKTVLPTKLLLRDTTAACREKKG